MTKHGEFNWIELQTQDPEAALEFYRQSAGWSFKAEAMPSGGTYWLALLGEKVVCGIWALDQVSDGATGNRWMVYLHVDNLDEALIQAQAQGAEILRDAWDVPGVGRIAMLRDPGGAEIGWVMPDHTPD